MALESPKMMRMRWIKPQMLSHFELYQIEQKSGANARIAWVGLICFADKSGRFVWNPELLRAHILPYDKNADFASILNGLEHEDMVHRYEHRGKVYGHLVNWDKHQGVNNKEPESVLPDHSKLCSLCTSEARVKDASATPTTTRQPHLDESEKCEVRSDTSRKKTAQAARAGSNSSSKAFQVED